jgi:hypothetical protein
MDEIFRKVINNNFSDLEGLTVDASIPVPEHMINEMITAAIQSNSNISYCKVSVSQHNRVSVNLKTPLWPWPLELKLRLKNVVDFTRSPKFIAWLENKVLLARIASFLTLPAGISIRDDQVVVDIGSFLSTPEQKRILELVRSVEIKTEEGKVIFDVKIEVSGERNKLIKE